MNYQSFEECEEEEEYRGITPMNPSAFRRLIKQFAVGTDADMPSSSQGVNKKRLSLSIWRHFVTGQQKSQTLDQKISLWEELERVLGSRFNGTTHVFGSTLNGFAANSRSVP